MVIAIRKKAA